MARELGLKPRSLIKNLPSPQQQWKLPVKQWIHELHECKDIDLAVWVSDSGCLRAMQKARSRAVNQLWQEYGIG